MEKVVLVSDDGREFVFTVNEGLIREVAGPWPAPDGVIELRGMVPHHEAPANVPEHILAEAQKGGQHVCHYDPVHCQTCYCSNKDGSLIRCVRHC